MLKPAQFVFIAMTLTAAGCGGSQPGKRFAFGEANQDPIIYLEPAAGTVVRFENVRYDQFGRIETYDLTVAQGDKTPVVIKLRQKSPPQQGKTAEYVAEIGGNPVPTLNDKNSTGLVGFTLKSPGGAVLAYQGTIQLDIKTDLAYDTTGRRLLAKQVFTHGSKACEIAYSDYAHDNFGRLAGYTATVIKAE